MIKILILESDIVDSAFIYEELANSEFLHNISKISLTGTEVKFINNYTPDIILIIYSSLYSSLQIVLELNTHLPLNIPLILIADNLQIDECVTLIKNGVSDIVVRKNISSLSTTILTTLQENPHALRKTSHHQQEEQFIEQSKYSILIKNSTDAILLSKKDGQILEANPAACQLFKMTEDEIRIAGRKQLVDEQNPNLAAMLEERNLRGIANGELKFRRKDGTVFLANVTTVTFTDEAGHEMSSITIRDLTKSIKVDEQLAKTTIELEEAIYSLKKVMNASMDLILSIDEDQKIVQINSACRSILGYESYELLNENYLPLIHKDDLDFVLRNEITIREGTPIKLFEARIIHKNGSTIYILLSAQLDKDDKIIYCTAKDITEKKQFEKASVVERERLLDFYNLSPACLAILKGPNHIHELTNCLYLKFLNKKDILGKSILEVLPEMEKQGIIQLLDDVYRTGIPYIAKEMLIQIDLNSNGVLTDTYMNFMYQAHRDSLGQIDGIFVFAIDVTEQVKSRIQIEESEKMYHQLISELPVAAYACDANGKIIFFNKAAALLWGTTPIIGVDSFCGFAEIFDEAGRSVPVEESAMAISLNEARIVSDWSGTVERVDGQKRYIVTHVVPYIDALGNVTGAVNMVTDITATKVAQISLELQNTQLAFQNQEKENRAAELVIANKELAYQNKEKENRAKELIVANKELAYQNNEKENRATELVVANKELIYQNKEKEQRAEELFLTNVQLVKTNKELDRFVYSVSHDLRSPLTSVQGLISIIESESRELETLKHIQMISTSIERLDQFIKRILSYSQNNRVGLDIEKIEIQNTVQMIYAALQNTRQAVGITFEVDIQEGCNFYSDKVRFYAILENLISNAVKYHKIVGSDRFIRVIAKTSDENLQLEIIDNGIGIPLEYHKKIFDMFFRISSKSEGSGIGLYIVKDTIEKLEGTVRILSPKKGGSTFKINLKNFKTC